MKEKLSHFIKNKHLLAVRSILLGLLIGQLIWRTVSVGPLYFYFLTNMNWVFHILYFGSALFYTIRRDRLSKSTSEWFFAAVHPLSWIVFFVFWIMLSYELFDGSLNTEDVAAGWINHTFNLIAPIFDLFLCKTIPRWFHVFSGMGFIFLYSAGVVMYHLLKPYPWPYKFLVTVNEGEQDGIRWGNTIVFVMVFCLISALFFGLTVGFVAIRERLGARRRAKKMEKVQSGALEQSSLTMVQVGGS